MDCEGAVGGTASPLAHCCTPIIHSDPLPNSHPPSPSPHPQSSTPGLPLLAPVTVRGRILTLLQETLALACTHPTHALFCNYLWTFQ